MKLSDERKANISEMAGPKQMPYDERKRQYSALRRAITRSCEPALLAKFSLSTDGEGGGWERTHAYVEFQISWYPLISQ